jgi:methionyl-tRNA formyltransferase
MAMDEGMDTGDILLQCEVTIGEEDTCQTLHDRLASLGARLLIETLDKVKKGHIQPLPQDPSKATYAPPLKKEDGHIDWKNEAEEIDRQVRAFNPWPGAFTRLDDRLLRIYTGAVRERPVTGKTGTVVWVGSDFIEVEAGRDAYIIKEVQLEGRRIMSIREFLPGHPIPVGTVFH